MQHYVNTPFYEYYIKKKKNFGFSQKIIMHYLREFVTTVPEYLVIELKANQRSLHYNLEDGIKTAIPVDTYKEEPFLEHGRIKSSTSIYDRSELIAGRRKWNGNLTVVKSMYPGKRNLITVVHLRSYFMS